MSTPAESATSSPTNAPPAQDIDSGASTVVNEGQPVNHTDMVDGQSVGHSAEPPSEDTTLATPPAETPPPEPPPKLTRDEIYENASRQRDDDINAAVDGMSQEDLVQYRRMIAEAGGGDDPYEHGVNPDGTPAQPAAQPQPVAQPDVPPAVDPAVNQPVTQPGVDAGQEMVTVTVYGMQEQATRADVDAAGGLDAYQKNRAADERMRRLSTYEARLRDYHSTVQDEARRVELTRTQPPENPAGTSDLPPTGDTGTADLEAIANDFSETLYAGDQEATARKFVESMEAVANRVAASTRNAPEPVATPPAPAATVSDPALAPDQASDLQEANRVFAEEFQDLNTPVRRQATLAMLDQVQKDPMMIGRPLAEQTRYAAQQVRADLGTTAPAPVTPAPSPSVPVHQPPQDLNGRLALKRRTVVTPVSDTTRRHVDPQPAGQQFMSNSEYVDQLRVNRGQPPLR